MRSFAETVCCVRVRAVSLQLHSLLVTSSKTFTSLARRHIHIHR